MRHMPTGWQKMGVYYQALPKEAQKLYLSKLELVSLQLKDDPYLPVNNVLLAQAGVWAHLYVLHQ